MPTYTFRDHVTDETFEANVPLARAPRWGETIEVKNPAGKLVRALRIMEAQACSGHAPNTDTVSRTLPKWDPAAKRHDKEGHPVFSTKGEREDFMKRKTDQGQPVAWD